MERNAFFLPKVGRVDLQLTQDIHTLVGGRRNSLELRADFLNFGNFLNKDWGISRGVVNNQPLLVSTSNSGSVIGCSANLTGLADACGRLQYRLRNFEDPIRMSRARTTTSYGRGSPERDVREDRHDQRRLEASDFAAISV